MRGGYKLLIWGAGKRASEFMQEKYFEGNFIEGIIDSVSTLDIFYDYPVFKPEVVYSG